MGTEKRERQKANRAQRREFEARSERKSRIQRTALQWGIGIAAAFGAVLLIAYFSGALGGSDEETTATTVATTAPPISVPTSDSVPAEVAEPLDTTATTGGAETSAPSETTAPANTDATSDTTADDTKKTDDSNAVADSTPTGDCPAADGSAEKTMTFDAAQPMCIDPAKSYTAEIVTNKGTVVAELFPDKAPLTVNNFVTLSRYHYYDGITCHRIIPDFMAQCGDPTGSGSGGPGYEFDDELPAAGEYKVGSLAMANAGPNTNGSQFFIITGPQGVSLPPNYSLFGQVTEGLDDTLTALDAAGNPENNGVPPLEEVTIESVTITES